MNDQIKNLHTSYLLTCQMPISMARKARVLGEALGHPDSWRVIGITKDAIKVFKEHNFKRVSRMGINRAHLVDRNTTYTTMLENPIYDVDEWWDFYYKNDQTILATSGENMSNKFSDITYFESNGMFRTSGFSWKHGKSEVAFLKELAETIL